MVAGLKWSGSGATGNIDTTFDSGSTIKHAFAVSLNPPAAGGPANLKSYNTNPKSKY